MLKSQTIENTWQCDACGCEENIVINPYYRILIQSGVPNSPSIQIDFCSRCIASIPSQLVADYIADNG